MKLIERYPKSKEIPTTFSEQGMYEEFTRIKNVTLNLQLNIQRYMGEGDLSNVKFEEVSQLVHELQNSLYKVRDWKLELLHEENENMKKGDELGHWTLLGNDAKMKVLVTASNEARARWDLLPELSEHMTDLIEEASILVEKRRIFHSLLMAMDATRKGTPRETLAELQAKENEAIRGPAYVLEFNCIWLSNRLYGREKAHLFYAHSREEIEALGRPYSRRSYFD